VSAHTQWVPAIQYGPKTHICWTPDHPSSPKTLMVIISNEDYVRACTELALLRNALVQLEGKANLGAEMCDTQGPADGFRVLAVFARAELAKAQQGGSK